MAVPRKAVVLAAGRGVRLRPLTDDMPKAMVPVCGQPVLARTLAALEAVGVEETVLVVGYLEGVIREAFGSDFGSMRLSYVANPDYATTNNIYSLWLARDWMNEDLLLLEGDLLFDPALLGDLSGHPVPDVAVVDNFRASMDGTIILPDGSMAGSFVLKKDQGEGFDYSSALKTVNIYKLSALTLRSHFVPAMGAFVAAERTGSYYEAVLGDLVRRGDLRLAILPVGEHRWAEVDDEDDLRRAETLFGVPGDGASVTVADAL